MARTRTNKSKTNSMSTRSKVISKKKPLKSKVSKKVNPPNLKKMVKPQLLLLSSSSVYGCNKVLGFARDSIEQLLKKNKVFKILFIPYALPDHNAYNKKIKEIFFEWGYKVEGIHNMNPIEAVKNAEAIYIGGGNTFLLLKQLYDNKLIKLIRERILNDGIPYIGSSAGTNVATISIHTTNDMPIVYPPSFNGLNLVPFNINPHYVDSDINSTHKGETREERIQQYLKMPHAKPVLGLREGTWLEINGNSIQLNGQTSARLFEKQNNPQEIKPKSFLNFLLK